MKIKDGLKNFFKDKWNIAFLIILVIAIIIRVRYMISDSIWPDEALYTWYGYKLLHSPSYLFSTEFTHTVSYLPSIIIAILSIFTNSFFAGKLMSMFFGIIGLVFVYLLGKEIKDGFVGLIAAILLSVNYVHWFYTDRVLLDVPLTAMFILTCYCLIKYDKIASKKWAILLATSMALTMYTKVAGLLVIPIVGLYFLLVHNKNILALFKRKDFLMLIGLFVLLILPLLIINVVNFGSLTVESTGRYISTEEAGADNLKPSRDFRDATSWYILPIAFLGIIFALLYRKKEDYLLLSWLLGVYLFFSLLHPQSLDRYVLPGVIPLFLLAATGIDELRILIGKIAGIKLSRWIFIGLIVALMIPLYLQANIIVKTSIYGYTGFKDAGIWLKDNAEENAVIFTDSTRAIRVFSLKEFDENNGELKGPAKTKEEFEKQISEQKLPIYLIYDQWEYIQPGWLYPLSQEKLDYIASLGFNPVNVVNKPYPTNQGLQELPVVIIFKKDS